MPVNIDTLARRFVEAWTSHRQFAADAASEPATAVDAYRIQDAVFAARYPGQSPRIWKIGAAGAQAEPNGAPIGRLLTSPAVVRAGDFHMLGIEAEVAFRLRNDLPASASGWSDEALSDAAGELLVTIELCDTRLADWKGASALWRLADFQLNGALIAGSGVNDWRGIDFAAQHAELWINGQKEVERAGAHPLGSPVRLLPWAAEHCAKRTGGLRAGDLITTGSWTGMRFVAAGDEVVARFPGIGEAALRIAE